MTAQTILPANSVRGGDIVTNSCRFNRADSADMTLSMSSGGSQTKFTKSFWVKRCKVGEQHYIYDNSSTTQIFFHFKDDDKIGFGIFNSGAYSTELISTQVFRDVSAWYHFVIAVDYTNGTQALRARIYVNGTEITAFDTETRPNNTSTTFDTFNSDKTHYIGSNASTNHYLHGYLAEVVHIDNAQLAPTSFGEFDSDSPTIWKPIDVSDLTFGTKGYHLDFKASGNLGNDANGGTDWTENNIVAGDQSTDTCQNNFCTLSPLYNVDGSYTLSEGNTQFLGTGGNDHTLGTLGVQGSGKWYFEAEFDTNSAACYAGFADSDLANNLATDAAGVTVFIGMYRDDHTMQIGGGNEGAYTDVSDGDIFGFAMNLDANSGSRTVIVQKNGSTIDTVTIPTANEDNIFLPIVGDTSGTDGVLKCNFGGTPNPTPSSAVSDAKGHGSFEYNPTIGGVAYLALCTKNLAESG